MKIIFVCTGNTCRSPMAKFLFEALLLQDHTLSVEVLSAGMSVPYAMPVSKHVQTLLAKKNIDASSHASNVFTPSLVDDKSLILTMSASHKFALLYQYPFLETQTYTLYEHVSGEHKDISDPFGGSLETYQFCMQEIETLVNMLYLQIKHKILEE